MMVYGWFRRTPGRTTPLPPDYNQDDAANLLPALPTQLYAVGSSDY